MAELIIMPKQGLQMTEGMITEWLAQEGQKVSEGEPLFEMETDKLSIVIDAAVSGTLLKILHPDGDVVPVAEPIAVIGAPGEDISSLLSPIPALDSVSDARIFSSPRARMRAEERGIDYQSISGTGPLGMVIERDVLNAPVPSETVEPKASPLARKIAEQSQVDLKSITGTGSHGKIMAEDVQNAVSSKNSDAPSPVRGERRIPVNGMRRIIAQRMQESLQTLAQANHRLTVDMSEAVRLREQLKAADIKISYNDIVIRCTARALKEFPMLNSTMDEAYITVKEYVNIGMAVATETGLLVPVIPDADLKTLPEIAAASKDLAARTKEGRLMPDELTGGTFTISNLGMFDIESFTAIINKPEAGILAVGKLEKKPVVCGDEIVIRPLMQLSLTYDHRIVDGAPAALFLRRIKQLLENPGLLL